MRIFQTAERVSQQDPSDNYVFQRSKLAYVESAKLVNGKVLELGTGSGYGLSLVSDSAEHFLTIDKFISEELITKLAPEKKIELKQMVFPPLQGIPSESFDFVISFQVIEHIKDDKLFINEIHRVLKPGGKFILTTPNKPASITRNPWHIREYTIEELFKLLKSKYVSVVKQGVFGDEIVMEYYKSNKASVAKITKFDILDLQHRLPAFLLQWPYDLLNRWNRRKLLQHPNSNAAKIKMENYYLAPAEEGCFDLFFIAEK